MARSNAIFDSFIRLGYLAVGHAATLYRRFARTVTIGVRAVVIDGEERVFLVKPSYASGWQLPGGDVEVGEAVGTTLSRELLKEGGISIAGTPQFFGIYLNQRISRRDHIALYVVRSFQQSRPERTGEITTHGFFSPRSLPVDTTPSTRARIVEVLQGQPAAEVW